MPVRYRLSRRRYRLQLWYDAPDVPTQAALAIYDGDIKLTEVTWAVEPFDSADDVARDALRTAGQLEPLVLGLWQASETPSDPPA